MAESVSKRYHTGGDGFQSPAGNLVDFHCHMLPKMDDGSRSSDMSLEMVKTSVDQGVSVICLTPHFYPGREDPESFLSRRRVSLAHLLGTIPTPYPLFLPGAEVQYYEGLTSLQKPERFCIGNSGVLLLEMPFHTWSSRMVEDVMELQRYSGLQIVLAHIERYSSFMSKGMLEQLVGSGVLVQANADSFLDFFVRGRLFRLLDEGMLHLLGSDSHNMTTRPPRIGAAMERIERKFGHTAVSELCHTAYRLLKLNDTKI